MEIIIKQKTFTNKESWNENEEKILIPIISVYFDVLTDTKAYSDNKNIGYFPIEILGNITTSDANIILACEAWITDNNVLSVYQGVDIDEYHIEKKIKDISRIGAIAKLKKDAYDFKDKEIK